jgi:hypothetical protein
VRWAQYAYAGTSRFPEDCRSGTLFTTVASGSADGLPCLCRSRSLSLFTLATVCTESTIWMDMNRAPFSNACLMTPSKMPPCFCNRRLNRVSVECSGTVSWIPGPTNSRMGVHQMCCYSMARFDRFSRVAKSTILNAMKG